MKIKPLGDRIIVKQIEAKERTASGLYLPDEAKKKPTRGIVTAVGPGKYNEYVDKVVPLKLKVGQDIYFAKYAGMDVEVDDEKYVMMSEADVLGIIEAK